MGRIAHVIVACALGWGGWALAQTTAPSWELTHGGRWVPLVGPTTQPAPEPALDRVEQMIQNRQADAAHKRVVNWLKANPKSASRDRGLYLLGQANFARGQRIMAFYNFEELLDKHPISRYWYAALDRQYDIADAFLNGYRRKFLGMPMFTAHEEAIEMLFRIQQRAPGAPLAEKALLRTADFYYAEGDFDLAADAYGAYIRSYPRSPYLPRVRLRQAFSQLAQFRGVRFDATPIQEARQQLSDLAELYPAVAEQENITAIVRRIDQAMARKLLVTARFYRKTKKPSAAAYYYRMLIADYGRFPEAQDARRELEALPATALPPLASTLPAQNPDSGTNRESR